MQHLIALAKAGLTHIHLLPVFDIASAPEKDVPRTVSPHPRVFRAMAKNNRRRSMRPRHRRLQLGLRPYHYGAPEAATPRTPTAQPACWSSGKWSSR